MIRFQFRSRRLAALAAIALSLRATMKDETDDDDDDDDGGDSGGGKSESELAQQVRRMIEKKGGGESGGNAVALMLLNENRTMREKVRAFRGKVKDQTAKAPKEGQVVISKEDNDLLVAFKALGKPEEVKAKMEKATTLETEKKERDVAGTIAEAARLAGIPQGALLAKLARPDRENFLVELKDETKDGKTVKVAYARANKEGSASKPLAEFAKTELQEYYPALIAKGADGQTATTQSQETRSIFTPLPEQSPAGTAPGGGDQVSAFIERRNKAAAARPNPLVPKPAATT